MGGGVWRGDKVVCAGLGRHVDFWDKVGRGRLSDLQLLEVIVFFD
jgi:hypothetical protein